jgi:hypothetical protein
MKLIKYIFWILPFLFISCLEQVESKYDNYQEATNDNLETRGWIPKEIILPSMTEIYLRTNIDINTCVFSYKLSSEDLKKVKDKLTSTNYEFIEPRGIKIPSWWLKGVYGLKVKAILEEDDWIYIAVNERQNQIYGWRN